MRLPSFCARNSIININAVDTRSTIAHHDAEGSLHNRSQREREGEIFFRVGAKRPYFVLRDFLAETFRVDLIGEKKGNGSQEADDERKLASKVHDDVLNDGTDS